MKPPVKLGGRFKIGQRAIVSGAGVGHIVGLEDFGASDPRGLQVQVEFLTERCPHCGQSKNRVEWANSRHVTVTR